MTSHFYANKTHFHKTGLQLTSVAFKVRIIGTRKRPFLLTAKSISFPSSYPHPHTYVHLLFALLPPPQVPSFFIALTLLGSVLTFPVTVRGNSSTNVI